MTCWKEKTSSGDSSPSYLCTPPLHSRVSSLHRCDRSSGCGCGGGGTQAISWEDYSPEHSSEKRKGKVGGSGASWLAGGCVEEIVEDPVGEEIAVHGRRAEPPSLGAQSRPVRRGGGGI